MAWVVHAGWIGCDSTIQYVRCWKEGRERVGRMKWKVVVVKEEGV